MLNLPVYALPKDTKPEDEFRRLAEDGLEKRLAVMPDCVNKEAYRKRLQHEMNIILEVGFSGYFLIVQEFVNWAKEHGISVGPGRGSAAGSLVAWAMRITNLDPLPCNLLFERFLNIERVALPDIDVDFCERRRSEVVQHMVDRYGKDAVAPITIFGTMNQDKDMRQFEDPIMFDMLGMKTLTMISDVLTNISERGLTPPDLEMLPLDDSATYDLYSAGETDGVFQMESADMRKYLRMLRPTCFEDIIAMMALYRPEPFALNMMEAFIKRKNGQEEIVYPHESLKECLKDTYGLIVYREQVIQIAHIIAKYTLASADLLRHYMGKKNPEAMATQRERFVSSATENSIPASKANEIFDLMEKSVSYSFNKSHVAAYALISYQTAWLKTHYKAEFMAALMTTKKEA